MLVQENKSKNPNYLLSCDQQEACRCLPISDCFTGNLSCCLKCINPPTLIFKWPFPYDPHNTKLLRLASHPVSHTRDNLLHSANWNRREFQAFSGLFLWKLQVALITGFTYLFTSSHNVCIASICQCFFPFWSPESEMNSRLNLNCTTWTLVQHVICKVDDELNVDTWPKTAIH